jgi:hypothetical protein
MKKLFVISSLTALGVLSAMAQGTINPNPGGSTGVLVDIQNPSINGGVAAVIGTPAVTAGFADAGKGAVNISLYAAVNGTSLANLEASTPLTTVANYAGALAGFQGTFSIAAPYNITSSGSLASWNGSAALEFIYFGATSDGSYNGWSAEATGITVATGTGLAPSIFGTTPGLINSFVLTPVPEPSTIVLGGLGAAALLAFRRRK